MKCEVEWLRVTDSPSWACTRTSNVRHYLEPEMELKQGQVKREIPDDFIEMFTLLKTTNKLSKHYRAGVHKVMAWIKELHREAVE
jgi:ketosteroid isomerase-like protein